MDTNFKLFGAAHLAILASVPILASLLARMASRATVRAHCTRVGIGLFLLLNTAVWHTFSAVQGWTAFPTHLPLALCDVTLALAIIATLFRSNWAFDLAYYGSFGAFLAVVTPDLWEPFPSYGTVQFFVAHCGMVIAVLFLIWSDTLRPRPGSSGRAFKALNVFALSIGIFNYAFGSNYLFLSAKPASLTPLDYFGPWPFYILVAEAVAFASFKLLWLPFRENPAAPRGYARGLSSANLDGIS